MNYLNKSHELYHEILSFLRSENTLPIDDSNLINLLHQYDKNLINLNPFKWNLSNSSDRQMIQSGKISQYPNIELNDEQKKAILEFSDEYDLNEIECLSLWIDMSDPMKRRLLESQLGKSYGIYDNNIPYAVRELFYFKQDCEINIVMELMKARYDTNLQSSKRNIIMKETNRLLCNGIAINILENLLINFRQNGQNLIKLVRLQGGDNQFQSHRSQTSWKQVLLRLLQQSECLFYIFYQTQIDIKENKLLIELIEVLSELIVLKEQSKVSTETDSSLLPNEWSDSLFQVLVILHLTHICAMEQIQTLYSRTNDNEPYLHDVVGNQIIPVVGSYDGMDKSTWKNGMAQGFTCLVLAILRQPYIDMRDPSYSPEEVFWFLDQASQLQAYSYIRLCILPVLQSFSLTANETSTHSLYMSVLCNFIHNLLTIFCLPVYDHLGFPFPDSKLKHFQDVQWLIQEFEKQEQNLLLNGDDGDYVPITPPLEYYGFSKLLQRDCLDDVLDMLSAVLLANPNYPSAFWIPGKYHPFTLRALQGVTTDSSLILPCLHFLTGLSNGINNNTCEPVYHFLNQKLTGFFDWNRFFSLIRQYAEDLGGNTSQGPLMSSPESQAAIISPEDSEVLESIVNLLGSVMKHSGVTQAIISDGLDPIGILFSLFVCRIDYTLKGAILRSLAAICASTSVAYSMSLSLGSGLPADNLHPDLVNSTIGSKISEQIWNSIEYYRLLPFSEPSNKELGGLIYELESVESVTGNYPVTDGFLTLLFILLQHENGIPVNLGYGYRIPGIVCYVDYLISEILYKMPLRSFSADGHGQLWKILSQVILILSSIIQTYPVNMITIDDLIKAKIIIKSNQDEKLSTIENSSVPPLNLFQQHSHSTLYQSLLEDFMDLDGYYPIENSHHRNTSTATSTNTGSKFTNNSQLFSTIRPTSTSSSTATKRSINLIQKVPKPKSAGFAVMCHILHNSRRLFDHLMNLLKQNSPSLLLLSRENEIQRKCQISLEIIKGIISEKNKLYFIKEYKEKKKHNSNNNSFLFRGGQYSYYSTSGTGTSATSTSSANDPLRKRDGDLEDIASIDNNLELPKYGWDEFAYDIPYWKNRLVSSILGLLYEVSLREKIFLTCVRLTSSSSPLTIIRYEKINELPILISIQLTELSTFLTSVLNGQPLTDITNYITLLPESLITYPSIPVLAVRILQYVCNSQLPSKTLNTLYNSTNGDRIISSCTQALVLGNDGLILSSNNQYIYSIRRYGGGSNDIIQSMGLIFTPSYSYTTSYSLASYSYYFTSLRSYTSTSSATATATLSSGETNLTNIFKENNDIREAILDLLLKTFLSNKSCLCHYLLGLLDSVDSVLGGKHSIEYRTSLTSYLSRGFHMRPGFPANCLDAIIDMISSGIPSSSSSSTSSSSSLKSNLLYSNPLQALKCYELLYRLFASKLTNNVIMKILWMRRESPKYSHFFQPHLERFLIYYTSTGTSTGTTRGGISSKRDINSLDENTILYDTARYNSCAWILKMIALELHSIELSSKEIIPQSVIQAILNLFFDPNSRINQNISTTFSTSTTTTSSSSFFTSSIHHNSLNNTSIFLIKILNSIPLHHLTIQLDGYDSSIGIQCMKKCSESYHVTYGLSLDNPRNEPPGQFTYINIQNLILLLSDIMNNSKKKNSLTTTTSIPIDENTSGLGLTTNSMDEIIDIALQYNKYNMILASLANLFQGWRQLVDISLLGCGSLLIGQQYDATTGNGSGNGGDDTSHWNLSNYHQQINTSSMNSTSIASIDKLVNYLLLPVLNILISQTSLEMILAEQLARSLLSMIALLRDICSNTNERTLDSINSEKSLLSPNSYELLIKGFFQAIIRRGNIHVTRINSSLLYRGYLYTCIVHLLRCGEMDNPSNTSLGQSFGTTTNTSNELRYRCMAILEPYVIDFIEIAASDASLDSPSNDLLSRISAISALGSVLSIIGPSIETIDYFSDSYTPSYKKSQQYHDTRYGTSTFLQSIYHLRDRGHLKRILLHVGLVDKSSSTSTCTSTTTTNTIPPPPPGLLEATLTLCSHIGSCRDGSNILLEYGVLLGINSLPIIPLPTSTSSNTAATSVEEENLFPLYSTTSGTNSHNNSTYTDEDIQIILEPTLRLLNVLGSTSPCYEILQQCCYFLINNSTIISYYLHLKLPTLKGLSIIYSILNLMCLIAPATTSTTTTTTSATTTTVPPSTSTSTITVSIWEIEMGPKGDMYTTNLNRLCRIFSSKPLPTWNHFNRMNSSFYLKKEQKYSWWTIIKPSTPYEENLNEKIILPPNCIKFNGNLDYPINWTKFDDLKFLLGLKILERISSFFRMRSNLCIMNSHGIRRGSMYNTSMESATSSIVVSIPSTPNPFPTHTAGTLPAGTPGTSSWMNNNPQSTISIGDAIGLLAINMDDISYSFESIASFYYHISSIFHHPHPQQDDNSKNGGGNNNNLSWLRESHTLSSPFDSIMKKRSIYEPNNPYKTSGSATPAATAGATATVPPGGTAATRNGTTTDHQILQINEIDYEINKLLLYTTESLLCTIYDLVILSSSSSSSSSIESSTWKNELMNCLQITEKFPSHSFIRQISRYILNQINEIIIVRK